MAPAAPSPSSTLTISPFSVKNWTCRFSAHGILVLTMRSIAHSTPSNTTPCLRSSRSYKYLDALTTAFVVILLVSNLIAQKVCLIGPLRGQRRRAAVSHHLHLRRRLHRGLRLRRLAPRHLARFLRHGVASTSSEPSSSRCHPHPAGITSRPSPRSSDSSHASWPPVSSPFGPASSPTPTPWPASSSSPTAACSGRAPSAPPSSARPWTRFSSSPSPSAGSTPSARS